MAADNDGTEILVASGIDEARLSKTGSTANGTYKCGTIDQNPTPQSEESSGGREVNRQAGSLPGLPLQFLGIENSRCASRAKPYSVHGNS
jgi:hypothetical protein